MYWTDVYKIGGKNVNKGRLYIDFPDIQGNVGQLWWRMVQNMTLDWYIVGYSYIFVGKTGLYQWKEFSLLVFLLIVKLHVYRLIEVYRFKFCIFSYEIFNL